MNAAELLDLEIAISLHRVFGKWPKSQRDMVFRILRIATERSEHGDLG